MALALFQGEFALMPPLKSFPSYTFFHQTYLTTSLSAPPNSLYITIFVLTDYSFLSIIILVTYSRRILLLKGR